MYETKLSIKLLRIQCVTNKSCQYPACVIPFGKADAAADAKFIRDANYYPPCESRAIANNFSLVANPYR
jgi:hypothetical protein